MKTIAADAMEAIEAGEVIVAGAIKATPRDPLLGDPIRVWGGTWTIEIDGEDYIPLGERDLVQQTAGAVGGVAQGMVLSLSGIEPNALPFLDPDEFKGARVVAYRLMFASDGKTLLDYSVFDRGRIDTVDTIETIGDEAIIKCGVESAARGLGKSGARMRADSDQRLILSTDGYFKFCAYAAEKMLYWGGKKPSRTGDALNAFPGGSVSIIGGATLS